MIKNAYFFGILTVLFWSTSATAFKLSLKYLDVLQLLFFSVSIATIVLALFLLITGKVSELFSLSLREYIAYACLGFLNPFIYYWMAFKAYDLLPAQIVQPINYTWAITLILLSVPLLKQTFNRFDFIATIVCYLGVVVVSVKDHTNGVLQEIDYWGVFLAVSCTLIWALYWIFNIQQKRDPLVGIFLNFLFSLPFILGACLLFSEVRIPSTEGLIGAIWVGCFEFGFTFVTWITALRLAKQTNAITNLIFLTPFVSLVFIYFVLGEQIAFKTIIGLVMIIAGLLFQKYASSILKINR